MFPVSSGSRTAFWPGHPGDAIHGAVNNKHSHSGAHGSYIFNLTPSFMGLSSKLGVLGLRVSNRPLSEAYQASKGVGEAFQDGLSIFVKRC